MLRMILECLSNEERRRFLHTEVYDDGYTLVHLIAQVDHTGATMKTILESISKDQHYSLLSTQDGLKYTPLHCACVYNNFVAVLDAITRLTSEETRFNSSFYRYLAQEAVQPCTMQQRAMLQRI